VRSRMTVTAARADSALHDIIEASINIGKIRPMQRPQQQAVADKLREMILHGSFAGGDRLLEIPLSEQLEVSRTPVREALITLADEGLVEYRPNRGYIVRSFTLDDIMNAYVVRETLEGLAVRLLAEKGLDRTIKRQLEDCLDEGDKILSVKRLTKAQREPWGEMNNRFHRLLVESTNNGALVDSLSRATNIPYSSSRVVHWFEDDDIEGLYQLRFTHSHHHTIYTAICHGEGYRAELGMRAHISFTADHIRAKYIDNHRPHAGTVVAIDDVRMRSMPVPRPPEVASVKRGARARATPSPTVRAKA
jgi:GntR family transcriptional regulator, vanillate catabolism transcriptional regulator